MSRYFVYKLEFAAGVHLGEGTLNSSSVSIHADTLFSALYIEALKQGNADQLLNVIKSRTLSFSDAFPYDGEEYYIPKPIIKIDPKDGNGSESKKYYKNLTFLPLSVLDKYLEGRLQENNNFQRKIYEIHTRTMAAVKIPEDTLPFQVAVCSFITGAGLYVLVKADSEREKAIFEELLLALSVSGIGGKRSSGLGRFNVLRGKTPETLVNRLEKTSGTYMSLSTSLPKEHEMEESLAGASYKVIKRSGFVFSNQYAQENRKKRDLYVMDAGSCFKHMFDGDIYDVSNDGAHPVFRYAIPFWMAV